VFPDPDAGSRVLAITGPEGTFDYSEVGKWADSCVIHVASGDGSHDAHRFTVPELCEQAGGAADCLQVRGMTVDLVRRRESSPPVELRVRTTPENLELRVDEAATCRTPCAMKLTPGLHRLELFEPGRSSSFWREQALVASNTELTARYESHRGRQEVAGWFLLPGTVGAVLVPIGLLKKNDDLLWAGAGLAVVGGVGFLLVWKSDGTDVTVTPLR